MGVADFFPESNQKSYWRRVKKGLLSLISSQRLFPYRRLVKLQRFWLSKTWVQKLFFRKQVQLMQRWAGQCSSPDISTVVLQSLMANTYKAWRNAALSQPKDFHKWVNLQGIADLENAIDQKHGVIIVIMHSLGLEWNMPGLNTRSSLEHSFVAGTDYHKRGRDFKKTAFAFQLIEVMKILNRGGIIYIAGDGLQGKTYRKLPVFGHMFPFRTGFAELAVRTGAIPMAAFDYLDLDGKITIEFVEMSQTTKDAKEEQVDGMVRQYAQMVAERWPRLLSSLRWWKLRQVMNMPSAPE